MKIGFIGMGNMAQAIVKGWNATRQQEAEEILAYAPNWKKLKANSELLGFTPMDNVRELVEQSDWVIMACKPYQVESVLEEVAAALKEKPLISIALGWDYARFLQTLGPGQRMRYIMPSTPAEVGEGVFLLEDMHNLTDEEEEISRLLFAGIGKVLELPSHLMGIGGTLSGCGPAFADMIIEAFGDAGVKYGLPREAAYALVSQMLLGAAKLQRDTGKHPGVLKDAVCSPGGSTIRGVTALEAHGLRAACQAAVDAVMQYKA